MKKGRKLFISTKLIKKKKPITYLGLSKEGILNTTSRGKCRHTATVDGGHLVTDTGFGNGCSQNLHVSVSKRGKH